MLLPNARAARRALFAPLPQLSGRAVRRSARPGRSRGRHGTTILAMHFADGLILAADRQTSGGHSDVYSTTTVKIEPITDDSALLSCGLISSSQFIEDALKVHCRSFEETTGYLLSTRGQVRVASTVARTGEAEVFDWSFGGILAGADADDTFRIFTIDSDGARGEEPAFVTDGSGYRIARTVLDLMWRPGLTHEEALRLAVQALYFAGKWDTYTSDARLVTPSVASVTSEGFAFIGEPDVKAVVDEVTAKSGR